MDVPFVSSGALSRAHYAIVRKVELESSPQQVDHLLLDEVRRIRQLLLQPATSLATCKECLVILLYCSMTSPAGTIDNNELYFALPHALNLAEAGKSVDAKRIGYLFCSEIMPADHELQLMLVNTLRKDLESPIIARICLALENVIGFASDVLIPAVQTRLHDLLSHNIPHIRRRALLALRSLSRFQPEMLERMADNLTLRLKDPDQSVTCAALIVASAVSETNAAANRIHMAVSDVLKRQVTQHFTREIFLRVLDTLCSARVSEENALLALNQLQYCSGEHYLAILLALFRLVSRAPSSVLSSSGAPFSIACINSIRSLLTSREPNDVYLFLSCLECIDPTFWSGKSPDFPAILEGWEVECIMQQLHSVDEFLRRKTLGILHNIDPNILDAFKLRIMSADVHPDALQVHILRLLEVLTVQSSGDGETYAHHIHDILDLSKALSVSIKDVVLEKVMENILLRIRSENIDFRIGCASTLLTILGDADIPFGATMMAIVAALAAEYCHLVSVHPSKLLSGLASRVDSYRPLVQDACLLAMLRVTVECDEITDSVKNAVKNLRDRSKSHIRRRCDQFIALSGERQTLLHLVQDARSASLPDFADALERYEHQKAQRTNEESLVSTAASLSASPSRPTLTSSELRYAAYDKPRRVPRLREQWHANSTRSVSSSRSDVNEHENVLSQTIAAGDLALAAGSRELEAISQGKAEDDSSIKEGRDVEEIGNRVDLISLDSPFISENSGGRKETGEYEKNDIEALWEALGEENGVRGWHSGSIEKVVRELKDLKGLEVKVISGDVPRLQGETIAGITRGMGKGLVRLRDAGEGGCVWRLRSGDGELRRTVKRRLWEE